MKKRKTWLGFFWCLKPLTDWVAKRTKKGRSYGRSVGLLELLLRELGAPELKVGHWIS